MTTKNYQSLRKLSALLQCDTSTVRQWLKEGMPRGVTKSRNWADQNKTGFYMSKSFNLMLTNPATGLEVSKSVARSRIKKGMPTQSIELAKAWWAERCKERKPSIRGEGWMQKAQKITGLNRNSISQLSHLYNSPKSPQCFAVWHLSYKRTRQVKRIFGKMFALLSRKAAGERRQIKNKKRYATDAQYRNRVLAATKRNTDWEKKLKNQRRWRREKYKTDCRFRLMVNARSRLAKVLKRVKIKKDFRTAEIIGCSPEELKIFLEAQFQPGMTWDNHGRHWHVDHVRPLASYNLRNRNELFNAFHYTNLQPLTAIENMRKGAKLIYEKAA